MLSAFIAAICSAGIDTTNKFLLAKLKMPLKYYLPYIFAFLVIISGLILFFVKSPIGAGAFSFHYIFLFMLMIAAAVSWNILISESLQTEPLHEYELIILMTPLVTIILATVLLPAERNIHIFLAVPAGCRCLKTPGCHHRSDHRRSFWSWANDSQILCLCQNRRVQDDNYITARSGADLFLFIFLFS